MEAADAAFMQRGCVLETVNDCVSSTRFNLRLRPVREKGRADASLVDALMSDPLMPRIDEVDVLLRNAELRDRLEPYFDEAMGCVDFRRSPTTVENDYLACMLAWEEAPVLPISQWFSPELSLPHPNSLTSGELRDFLWQTIHALFEKRIVLDFTDHLSDRDLYQLIRCDILPAREKKIEVLGNYLHWDCVGAAHDPEAWLRFYATAEERLQYLREHGGPLPPCEAPPYPRRLPKRPL